jgi:TonB-dependent SusC/RagA subfamily outer membrane receptor
MKARLALTLVLIVAAGCAEKLTGPAAQSAAREYQSKTVAPDSGVLAFVNGKEVPVDSLRLIVVDDIEGVEVLKSPKARQLYGARAHIGVILVTTKR